MLTTAAREAGATAFRVGIIPDDARTLMNALEDQLIRADLVLTSGGVSVGAGDVNGAVAEPVGLDDSHQPRIGTPPEQPDIVLDRGQVHGQPRAFPKRLATSDRERGHASPCRSPKPRRTHARAGPKIVMTRG